MVTKNELGEADRMVKILAETYQVQLARDWGEQASAGSAAWNDGFWSLQEIHILQQAVADLARAMGGAARFVHHLGSITISQIEMTSRGRAQKGLAKFTAAEVSFDAWTIVHEFGHIWDANFDWRLSIALERYTGGRTFGPAKKVKEWLNKCDEEQRRPGCNKLGYFYSGTPPAGADRNFNRREDFAESVAAYVYPEQAQKKVERYRDHPLYRPLLYYADYTQTARWAFVDGLVKGSITV